MQYALSFPHCRPGSSATTSSRATLAPAPASPAQRAWGTMPQTSGQRPRGAASMRQCDTCHLTLWRCGAAVEKTIKTVRTNRSLFGLGQGAGYLAHLVGASHSLWRAMAISIAVSAAAQHGNLAGAASSSRRLQCCPLCTATRAFYCLPHICAAHSCSRGISSCMNRQTC